jgi:hypothetical protein
MMSDLIKTLRDGIGIADNIPMAEAAMDHAADEIERLRAALLMHRCLSDAASGTVKQCIEAELCGCSNAPLMDRQ